MKQFADSRGPVVLAVAGLVLACTSTREQPAADRCQTSSGSAMRTHAVSADARRPLAGDADLDARPRGGASRIRRTRIDGFEGVAIEQQNPNEDDDSENMWMPDDATIGMFETEMQGYIHGLAGFYPLTQYRRRYQGEPGEPGSGMMQVVFVCLHYTGVWDHEVFDASRLAPRPECIFTVFYNVEERSIVNIIR